MLLTDEEIAQILACGKRVKNPQARWKVQNDSRQKNYQVESDDGLRFEVYLRQNLKIIDNFSCGLLVCPDSGEPITLLRYNGPSHPHNNPIEGQKLGFVCHIHRATQRYIESGRKPDHYASETDRYTDLDGALLALATDCNLSGLSTHSRSVEDLQVRDLFD